MRPGRQLKWRLAPALWVLLTGFAFAGNTETDVKAAFIYNFTKFVEWPDSALAADAPLHLCMLGRDDIGARLRLLHGREAQGHPLHVRALESATDHKGCHVIYVAKSAEGLLPQLMQQIESAPVLTVSDSKGFVRKGGMIELFVESSRVQFSINTLPAQTTGLKISARMLQLARVARRAEK